MKGHPMSEPASSAAAGIALSKLLPAGIGAAIMIAVDMPKTRGELFARLFVAFAFSHLFGDAALALLGHYAPGLADLKGVGRALDGTLGALGFFVAGGVAVLAKRFKKQPLQTADKIRRALKGEP
jgi:hypothetical protein